MFVVAWCLASVLLLGSFLGLLFKVLFDAERECRDWEAFWEEYRGR